MIPSSDITLKCSGCDWCLDPNLREQLQHAWEEYEKRGDVHLLQAYLQLVESVPDDQLKNAGYYSFS